MGNKLYLFLFLLTMAFYYPIILAAQEDEEVTVYNYDTTQYGKELRRRWEAKRDKLIHKIDTSEKEKYYKEKKMINMLDSSRWKEITKGLNYSEKPRIEKKFSTLKAPELNLKIDQLWIKIVLFALAAGILAFILFRLFKGNRLGLKSKKHKQQDYFDLENLEENIHETDLEKLLQQATEQGDFKLAIRIYYLILIKTLSQLEYIVWEKDKTNRNYLTEMLGRKEYSAFRKLTLVFEKTWYGNREINQGNYQILSMEFQLFLTSIQPVQTENAAQ